MSVRGPAGGVSALLLAGGQSTRMGADKAELCIGGQVLWRRQLEILRAAGAEDLWICGRPGGAYCGAAAGEGGAFQVVFDEVPGQGPMAGLVAGMRRVRFETVMVLAVDLPAMEAGFLRALLEEARRGGRGVVPSQGGRFEPLTAIYTLQCLPLLEARLVQSNGSLQYFIGQAVQRGLLAERPIDSCEARLFLNVNTPADLAAIERRS